MQRRLTFNCKFLNLFIHPHILRICCALPHNVRIRNASKNSLQHIALHWWWFVIQPELTLNYKKKTFPTFLIKLSIKLCENSNKYCKLTCSITFQEIIDTTFGIDIFWYLYYLSIFFTRMVQVQVSHMLCIIGKHATTMQLTILFLGHRK